MNNIKYIKPFTKFCMTIGMIPSSYKVSLTYEEQLLWLCNYLENTVIPTVNNNAEAVTELQKLFTQLQNYVSSYFDSLDVQTEIDNKLDEMVLDGTLANIINSQIFDELNNRITALENNLKYFNFNTLSDLINSDIVQNVYCQTLGYNSIGDGGDGRYYISSSSLIPDDGKIIALESGKFAVLLDKNPTPEQYGIFESNEDNHDKLQNYFSNNDIINLPNKTYNVIGNLRITGNKTINSNHCKLNFTNNYDENLEYALLIGNNVFTQIATEMNLTKYNNSLVFENNLEYEDIIKIVSSESWNTSRPAYTKGQFAKIRETGSTLTLFDYFYDDYSNATILKLNTNKINLNGDLFVNCVNNLYDNGIKLSMLKDCVIDKINCVLNGTRLTSIFVSNCYNVVLNNVISKLNTQSTGNTDYGLSISSSQFIKVNNAYIYGNRHACTLTNTTEYGSAIVNRFINVNGDFFSTNNHSLDTHGGTEYANFKGNCYNSAGFGGQFINFEGNIYNKRFKYCISFAEVKSPSFNIQNSNFYNLSPETGFALITFANYDINYDGILKIINNNFYDNTGNNIQILNLQPSSSKIDVFVLNNYVAFNLLNHFTTVRNISEKLINLINYGGTVANSYSCNYPNLITSTINSHYN